MTKIILLIVLLLLVVDFRTKGYKRYHKVIGSYLIQLEHWWTPNNFICCSLPGGLVIALGFWSLAIEHEKLLEEME